MFNWAKQQLANVAGTQEPIYGPSAVRSVSEEAKETPYTEITRHDLKWRAMDSTCVETQTFYLTSDNGDIGFAQVIYSNVAGMRTTCQFNSKIFSKDASKPHSWCSNPLNNFEFNEDKTACYADDCAIELSADGNEYTIKSMNDQRAIVNLKITRTAPGFVIGKTGTTKYGTNPEKPWGTIRHVFWPRCATEGTITTPDGPVDFKGRAMYSFALQGMKPHHAAARWNFANFQGPNYSAIIMEFTTPVSYGNTVVNVGGIVKDGQVLTAGAGHEVVHTDVKKDADNEWPEPSSIKLVWNGTEKDAKPVSATIEGDLGPRSDRIDVMAEVPGFVKSIVAAAAGTKPYIYQYTPNMALKLKIGDEEITEQGQLFMEASFIAE